ncbi:MULTISPECIES: hypothetical protein [unclassified Streptococcus]|uniref:hypothetical protein n=1 Tax=unclassified Streptococcus TaxID=2608887 RepID=UPI00025B2167|nr:MULTISPECIES: hypothetical protein [unclassified Streptococcus]EIF36159.1 hypothetical protein HMPREF1116_1793 [Streptococcus sp. SK140]OFK86800.1 hypothetical protein HMPREF2795_07490 [Streptococcus sp. HMSC056C01]
MKKIITLSTLLLCSLSLIACSNSEKKNEVKTEASSSVQEASSQESSSSQKQTEETQVVGSDDYGYVKIPKSWVHFKEIEGGDDIQYCDGTDVNIVTLNTFKPEQFGISESEYAALETVQISTSIYESKQKSQDFSKVWGSKSTIGGYEAYVVNCIAKNGKYLIIWVFKSDDGKFRYVSLEGVPEVLKNLLPMVEESWTNKKS